MSSDPETDDRFDLAEYVVSTGGPADAREAITALVGDRPVGERLAENGVRFAVDDLFGHDEETRHELHLADRVEYLPCVADALEAAVLVDDEPVTVRSFDPVTDEPVVVEVGDETTAVTPESAVVSVGMDADVPDSMDMTELTITASCGGELPGGRDPEEFSSVVCAYINAFESVETYEEWASDVDAVSLAIPAAHLVPEIRAFVAGPAFD